MLVVPIAQRVNRQCLVALALTVRRVQRLLRVAFVPTAQWHQMSNRPLPVALVSTLALQRMRTVGLLCGVLTIVVFVRRAMTVAYRQLVLVVLFPRATVPQLVPVQRRCSRQE